MYYLTIKTVFLLFCYLMKWFNQELDVWKFMCTDYLQCGIFGMKGMFMWMSSVFKYYIIRTYKDEDPIYTIYIPLKIYNEIYVHVYGTAQKRCFTTITHLHCKERCHLPIWFWLSYLLQCLLFLSFQSEDMQSDIYYTPGSTREYCTDSQVLFLLYIWRPFQL
jgi:hypothetical protein